MIGNPEIVISVNIIQLSGLSSVLVEFLFAITWACEPGTERGLSVFGTLCSLCQVYVVFVLHDR